MRYLHTKDALTIEVLGKIYTVSSEHPDFGAALDIVRSGRDPVEVLGALQSAAFRVRAALEQVVRRQNLPGEITYSAGVIHYDGKPLYNYAAQQLLKFIELGYDVGPLAAFVAKQQKNPNPAIHEELYKFLEVGKIPLTEDGDFLTYKAVRADYKDIHSGTFDNSVGQRPRIQYGAVDPDRNNLCSRGLHVCSFGYLPSFANADGHVMICKVDPRDVVSIPKEYELNKMRVCSYEVVGEVTSYYEKGHNVLAEERLASQRYQVRYLGGSDIYEVYDQFFTEAEAAKQAEDLKVGGTASDAWVVDTSDYDKEVYRA